MNNINNQFMISLIKSLLYILMHQHISLRILRMIVVMTRGYRKCYNASLLIYMRLIKSLLYILMNQHIFLRILRMIVVITRGYRKCYNASLLIYRR